MIDIRYMTWEMRLEVMRVLREAKEYFDKKKESVTFNTNKTKWKR